MWQQFSVKYWTLFFIFKKQSDKFNRILSIHRNGLIRRKSFELVWRCLFYACAELCPPHLLLSTSCTPFFCVYKERLTLLFRDRKNEKKTSNIHSSENITIFETHTVSQIWCLWQSFFKNIHMNKTIKAKYMKKNKNWPHVFSCDYGQSKATITMICDYTLSRTKTHTHCIKTSIFPCIFPLSFFVLPKKMLQVCHPDPPL